MRHGLAVALKQESWDDTKIVVEVLVLQAGACFLFSLGTIVTARPKFPSYRQGPGKQKTLPEYFYRDVLCIMG
jgi:hypothetical protein